MPPNNAKDREAVKVSVRLRPMSQKEIDSGFSKVVEIDQKNSTVRIKNPQGQYIQFSFDFCFPEDVSQEEVYNATAMPIVNGVLEGYNGTIFAYGQTGTGKTFSMDGKPAGELRGIMPRAFDHIFEYIQANSADTEFLVTVTYVEIYNNELRDLLSEKSNEKLKIREDPTHGVQIKGVAVHKVKDVEEIHALLNYGKKNRVVRKTQMNSESSRSHSIFTVTVETLKQIDGQDHVRSARLNLVDLAGSERVAKTGAEGVGFTEGVNINYELMILGNCIAALTSKGNTHIPYRDSKLTMLLRDSLGGNARTMMIAALGPADYNFSETMSTLRYAERAKKIENKPTVNMDPKDALLLQLKNELEALESQINQKNQLDAQMGATDDVIAAMEKKLEEEREAVAKQSNMAQKERDELMKKMEQRKKQIENEKEKREGYQKKLDELKHALENSNTSQLIAKTAQNEQQIREAKAKLAAREEKAKKMMSELAESQAKQDKVNAELHSMEQNMENVQAEYNQCVEIYKNLKIMMQEVPKTINADREQMSEHLLMLGKKSDFYSQIVDNFIPEGDVKRIKDNAEYDEETNTWSVKPMDKKKMVAQVLAQERPKSAYGCPRPIAQINQANKALTKTFEESSVVVNIPNPQPVKSRLKKAFVKVSPTAINHAVDAAFKGQKNEITINVNEI